MSPKISIVVPMYNVEKYLDKCVESLLCQTLTEIEIILVDDGSPDQCGAKADNYAVKDKRVRVIHQENQGLGPARNSGMRIATGEYIGFVDSDDYTGNEMFEHLYNAAIESGADIVAGGHCDVTDGRVTVKKVHPMAGKTFTGKAEIDKVRKNLYGHAVGDNVVEAFPMSMWIAIYRRKMIVDNKLEFKEIQSEDTIFNIPAYKCANKIAFIDRTDYYYRVEGQPSIMRSFSKKKMLRYQEFLSTLYQMACDEEDQECLERFQRKTIDACRLYTGIVDSSNLSFKEKKSYLRSFIRNPEINQYWVGYPVSSLPLQQRVYHFLLTHACYGMALHLNSLRQKAKKKGWH